MPLLPGDLQVGHQVPVNVMGLVQLVLTGVDFRAGYQKALLQGHLLQDPQGKGFALAIGAPQEHRPAAVLIHPDQEPAQIAVASSIPTAKSLASVPTGSKPLRVDSIARLRCLRRMVFRASAGSATAAIGGGTSGEGRPLAGIPGG